MIAFLSRLNQSLLISVYGMSKDTYRHFTNKENAFTNVIKGIVWASKIKSLDLTVTMNLCQQNLSDLDPFLSFCQQNDIKHEVGQYLVTGRASKCIKDIQLSKDQLLRYETIQSKNRTKTRRPFRRRSCDSVEPWDLWIALASG